MAERLVDVEKRGSRLLHTFPVTTSAPPTEEEPYKQKALEAAANAKLIPSEELESLDARIHAGRGGQLTPFGDPHGVLAETKEGLDQVVRERAYLLWNRQVARKAAPRTSGIRRRINASANAPTRCGSGKAVRKARRTSIGFGLAPLRKVDAPSRRWVGRLSGRLFLRGRPEGQPSNMTHRINKGSAGVYRVCGKRTHEKRP
jgi:hypothetical protein